jgi:hypothetical protein
MSSKTAAADPLLLYMDVKAFSRLLTYSCSCPWYSMNAMSLSGCI